MMEALHKWIQCRIRCGIIRIKNNQSNYSRLAMSPAILYLVTTTSSAIVGSSSDESTRSAIAPNTLASGHVFGNYACA